MENLTEIQKLYEKIPKTVCKNGCCKCCSDLIQVAKEEDIRMGGYHWNGKCIHLKDNKCSVYENRAFICRLFGASELLKCSECVPEFYLSETETTNIVKQYLLIKSQTD